MKDKMKIMVAGDVHGDFAKLNRFIARHQPSVLLQCGDFGFWPRDERFDLQAKLKPGSTRIHFIDVNHEDHFALEDVQRSGNLEIMENCFFQPRGSTLKLPDGRRVLFAGGGLSVDNAIRKPGHDWFPDHELLTESDLAKFPDPGQVQIDVVISHTAPL